MRQCGWKSSAGHVCSPRYKAVWLPGSSHLKRWPHGLQAHGHACDVSWHMCGPCRQSASEAPWRALCRMLWQPGNLFVKRACRFEFEFSPLRRRLREGCPVPQAGKVETTGKEIGQSGHLSIFIVFGCTFLVFVYSRLKCEINFEPEFEDAL